jgi:hypothetical protein
MASDHETSHFHTDERGVLVRCYHKCRTAVFSGTFWTGVIVSNITNVFAFPFEHVLWEKVWPFYHITAWLGL